MSYKCAILGHNYGDAEVEREREEDGKEVVITIREVETCARCGETRVVSENKEVTTLETAADIVADDLEEESADSPAEPETEPTPAGTTGDASQDGGAGSGPPIPDAEADDDSPPVPEDAPEDDAVILDDGESDEDEREPGEWPEEETEQSEVEELDGTEEERSDDADRSDGARGPGEWPDEETEQSDDEWEPPSDIDPQPETERSSIESTGNAITVPEGVFYCPSCEFSTAVESSSLRAGDFCPECHKAALEHRSE